MILTLDISSLKTGVAFAKDNGKLYHFSYIETPNDDGKPSPIKPRKNSKPKPKQFKDLFDKVEHIVDYFKKFDLINSSGEKITKIYIEEPLSRVGGGQSSIHTLSVLFKVNFAVASRLYDHYGVKPIYCSVHTIRKIAGLKKNKEMEIKDQVLEFVCDRFVEFKNALPEKKLSIQDPFYDTADALMILLAVNNGIDKAISEEIDE